MGGLNDVLEALLYRKSDRDAFLAGDLSRFGLCREDEEALGTIDKEQLVSASKLAREHVLTRSHRGAGTLLQMFARTIASWQTANPARDLDALATDFVGSRHFHSYRTHPFAGEGIGLEEAFFRFAEDEGVGEADVRFRECAIALLRGLLVTSTPCFVLPAFVHSAPAGFFVVSPHGLTLFAVVRGKFIEGAITPYIASVLTGTPPCAADVPGEAEQKAVREELSRLGLL